MKELIAIRPSAIGQQEVNTVNARDLHSFLGIGKDFSSWIKKQIERARLVENRDYLVFTQKGENLEGGRPTTEYHLTLEAGKHIAMLSGTEKGFEVREYFIECEKISKQQPTIDPIRILNDPAAMRGLLLTYSEKVLSLEATVTAQAPKVAALDRISTADGFLCITDTAKNLQVRPKDLFAWMSANSWIYRRAGGKGWIAYQDRLQQGVLSHKITTVERSDGTEKVVEQVLVTPKGVARLAEALPKRIRQMLITEARA